MTFTQSILKAKHFNIRDYKTHINSYFKSDAPQIVTVNGKPQKIVLNYSEIIELIDIFDELQDPELMKEIQAARKSYHKNPKETHFKTTRTNKNSNFKTQNESKTKRENMETTCRTTQSA
jgi:hypothetical protein